MCVIRNLNSTASIVPLPFLSSVRNASLTFWSFQSWFFSQFPHETLTLIMGTIMMMVMMMKSHDFLIVASRHLVGHHRAELGELYTSSVVDVVLHYCQQYDDCWFVTTRWLNGRMSKLGNATTITCKKYMMSQLYIVDVLIMIIIMPTPHSSTQVFRSLLDFVPLLALPNPIPDWSARSYNICYRQSLWAFISCDQLSINYLINWLARSSTNHDCQSSLWTRSSINLDC